MTRKHYKELAEILNRNGADSKLCKDIAEFCKRENRNFKMEKFLEACRQG